MDNWQHRSANMKCMTCMWWSQKKESIGRCRRRAPTMNGFPVVYDSDWCGDHKLDEDRRVKQEG
jgi:inosine/xanthosine triphosphate pyrophosphatase family protein